MKVLVISGSPKGTYSVTLQSILYLQKVFPSDEFDFLHVGAKIKSYEKDFSVAKQLISAADAIVFAYPVYTCLAPAQLHRFIELMFDNGVTLDGKFVTQFTTSKHFYDMTAHRCIELDCADLSGKYVKGLSADMNDLTLEKGKTQLREFWRFFRHSCNNNLYELNKPINADVESDYTAALPEKHADKTAKTVAVVTNCTTDDKALLEMLNDFENAAPFKVKFFWLSKLDIKGGCLGCLNCSADGECVYTDGFQNVLRGEIEGADAMVTAFSPRHHCMGADFKRFDDRRFCNGHRTLSAGKPTAFIVGKSLAEEDNLKMLLEARAEIAGNYLCGIVTPDGGNLEMQMMIDKLSYSLENHISLPQNYYGEGGRRIFRDLVYEMQGIMRADHKFYKSHGIYDDMPNKHRGTRNAMKFVGIFFNNKSIKKKLGNKLNEGMLMNHKKAINEAKPED